MKAIPKIKDENQCEPTWKDYLVLEEWAKEAKKENKELTKQAAHWHEAYAKSEAGNAIFKEVLLGIERMLLRGMTSIEKKRVLQKIYNITKALEE